MRRFDVPRETIHRNIKTRDRRQLTWYSEIEEELTELICKPATGITVRKNKGSSCFVGPENKPVFELACEGTSPGDWTFGIEKSRVDQTPTLAAIPWKSTFRVIPVNANDSAFYVVPLSGVPAVRRERVAKLLDALGFHDDGKDDLGEAIDKL
jgi:hypothetical protein